MYIARYTCEILSGKMTNLVIRYTHLYKSVFVIIIYQCCMWFQHICTQLIYTTSPSLSMIVTVAAELGPTCTPLEMRSSAMDRSSWKVSMVSMRSSFVMTTVKSALVRPAGKSSWYCCDTKSSPPWEKKKELVNANVDVYKVWRCNYECLYTCDGGWSFVCLYRPACYAHLHIPCLPTAVSSEVSTVTV